MSPLLHLLACDIFSPSFGVPNVAMVNTDRFYFTNVIHPNICLRPTVVPPNVQCEVVAAPAIFRETKKAPTDEKQRFDCPFTYMQHDLHRKSTLSHLGMHVAHPFQHPSLLYQCTDGQEAESSRKEVLDLRSKVSEEKTRSTEREREVEITREELSSLRKAWRTKEGELERRLREVQEVHD